MATTIITPETNGLAPTATLPRAKSRAAMARTAFGAILWRDIWVTLREFIPFLLQVLMQPLFYLFIFGKILPGLQSSGSTSSGFTAGYAGLLLPGIVALTCFTTALQGVTLPLVLDLGFAREIDDRLQSPLPVAWVAVEKVLFAAMRGMIGGTVIFPLAYWILGSGYVRTDAIPQLIGTMILTTLAGATVGLTIGTLVKPEQIGLMFALILTPLLFTGCTFFPWTGLGSSLKWFQIVTLFNPLTYASEGMRNAMEPALQVTHPDATGQIVTQSIAVHTLDVQWIFLGLAVTIIGFFIFGVRTFRGRVVS